MLKETQSFNDTRTKDFRHISDRDFKYLQSLIPAMGKTTPVVDGTDYELEMMGISPTKLINYFETDEFADLIFRCLVGELDTGSDDLIIKHTQDEEFVVGGVQYEITVKYVDSDVVFGYYLNKGEKHYFLSKSLKRRGEIQFLEKFLFLNDTYVETEF
ncbi:hypothetical protein [Bacillus cereus]|uniref:Uncharacterized protein n=1 Tax=Bacillus cereus HuA3-9 TaxID=1053205 RepID=R8CIG7_BACCE|nr:hypothetical protein [Bacillus cereus]EOO11434.1 hypothetical protein IGA_05697 [Bacillus cereus HuA3-9]